MQFFFRGLLVAAITYFLKLGHGLHIYCSDPGPPTGRRNNGPSMGRSINGPSLGRMVDWPNMGQQHNTLSVVNGLELESSVHGPTIMGHHYDNGPTD